MSGRIFGICVLAGTVGASPVVPRLHGGTEASNPDFPYVVSIYTIYGFFMCAGVILSADLVLTSAHCGKMMTDPDQWQVFAGSVIAGKGDLHQVIGVVVHPDHESQLHAFNFALVWVEPAFEFVSAVKSVELVEVDEATPYLAEGVVAGWEFMDVDDVQNKSEKLMAGMLTVYPEHVCEEYLQEDYHASKLCAASLNDATSTCRLNEGGPVVVDGKLYGIIMEIPYPKDVMCQHTMSVEQYARVAVVRKWINGTTGV